MTPLLEQLRHHTKTQHQLLERSLDVIRLLSFPSSRLALLRRLFAVYEPAERALLPFLVAIKSLEFRERCKTSALRRDLQTLGLPAEECLQLDCAPPPRLRSRSHALGFAYVLEGASLGGHVIRKQLGSKCISIDDLVFFDFYGDRTGMRWREFCDVLEAECSDQQAAVSGASDGFAYVCDGLLSHSN
jgi:heme oxygenase